MDYKEKVKISYLFTPIKSLNHQASNKATYVITLRIQAISLVKNNDL